jgi:cell division protein FtsB
MKTRLSVLTDYLTRLIALVLAVMILYLLVGSAMRLADNQKQARRRAAAQAEYDRLVARHQELQTQLQFIQSQAAVVLWARNLGLARPYEVPVILVEPEGRYAPPRPTAAPEEPASAGADERREPSSGDQPENWWELLFGP